MKAWQLQKPYTFEELNDIEPLKENTVKVKITDVALCLNDIFTYNGRYDVNYPIIPGQQAIGIVSEFLNETNGFNQGERVFIKPHLNCGQCSYCLQNSPKNCLNLKSYGKEINGFLRDFAVVPVENLVLLPENITDNDANFINSIAICINALNALQASQGDYIVILGADIIGTIMAQLAVFYHLVPIVIDDSEARLENLKQFGITYLLNSYDRGIKKTIIDITGGKLAECVIIPPFYDTELDATAFISIGGKIAVVNLSMPYNINIQEISSKQLSIFGISNGLSSYKAAINMIVNKTVKTDFLIDEIADFKNVPDIFEKMEKKPLTKQTIIKI